MKESYGEGVASHTDPESCRHVSNGPPEALTGAHAGQLSSREMGIVRGADTFPVVEGNTAPVGSAKTGAGPARSENLNMHGTTVRENREIPSPPTVLCAGGRIGKSEDVLR